MVLGVIPPQESKLEIVLTKFKGSVLCVEFLNISPSVGLDQLSRVSESSVLNNPSSLDRMTSSSFLVRLVFLYGPH